MLTVGVNIRPDRTQIVSGAIKNNQFFVERVFTMHSVFRSLHDIEILQKFFHEVSKKVGTRNATWYVNVPDELAVIDCEEREPIEKDKWNTALRPWLYQMLRIDSEQYYVSAPFVLSKKNKVCFTGAAIKKSIIDTLVQAADGTGIVIESVEFSSLGLLRFIGDWEREYCILEIWEHSSSIVGYSPIKGMFRLPLHTGVQEFLLEPQRISEQIALHDYTAHQTYGRANTNIPIYVITSNHDLARILFQSELRSRIATITMPDQIQAKKSGRLPSEELLEYCVPLGICLGPLYERVI